MILKREFYFVRHGQTDHNKSMLKTDHGDIPLNETGRMQAQNTAPLIRQYAFGTICCSPLRRAKETKELLLPGKAHLEMADLGECTAEIWMGMTALNKDAFDRGSPTVRAFLSQVRNGLNQALGHPGPVLVVAHGGVHWAICYWMEIENHDWMIENCRPVHFSVDPTHGQWKAKLLYPLR